MRKSYLVAAAAAAMSALRAQPCRFRFALRPAGAATATANDLRPASDFAAITDERARALALFAEAGRVLMHPRCVNCHPAGDSPHQTDRMRLHQPLVVRGAMGTGADAAMQYVPRPAQLRAGACSGSSRMAPGAGLHGVGRPLPGPDLRTDQGPCAQTAAATWRVSFIISERTRLSAGPGRPERPGRPRRGRRRLRADHARMGDAGAHCPPP